MPAHSQEERTLSHCPGVFILQELGIFSLAEIVVVFP